jgi:hypothetical protein
MPTIDKVERESKLVLGYFALMLCQVIFFTLVEYYQSTLPQQKITFLA